MNQSRFAHNNSFLMFLCFLFIKFKSSFVCIPETMCFFFFFKPGINLFRFFCFNARVLIFFYSTYNNKTFKEKIGDNHLTKKRSQHISLPTKGYLFFTKFLRFFTFWFLPRGYSPFFFFNSLLLLCPFFSCFSDKSQLLFLFLPFSLLLDIKKKKM